MKALFAAVALLTAVTASAQNSQPMTPPPGQAVGTQPPTSSPSFRGGDDDYDDDYEFRRGRRGTLVVVEREDLEQRLARLERLLGDAFERSGRGQGKGKLREAYEELNDIREVLADAPEARGGYGRPRPGPTPPPAPVYQPIAERELQRIMNAMAREPFGDDKMNVLETAVGNNYFTVHQVMQVLPQFQFSKDKLEAVRVLWSRVLDRQNSFQLYNAFQFPNDKAELKRIING
jgi:hypothetical protein